jgi:hypothetical protein
MAVNWAHCTSSLSGTFAFAYLLEETLLHLSSYVMIEYLKMEWITIFAIYAGIAVLKYLGHVVGSRTTPFLGVGLAMISSKHICTKSQPHFIYCGPILR